MNNNEKTTVKEDYKSPDIIVIELDNEISLTLESTPPTYESENNTNVQDYLNNSPFKNNQA